MRASARKAAALFVVWMALSGSHDAIHIALGLGVALVVTWLNPASSSSPVRDVPFFGILGYLPWLFTRILSSGLHLTRLILDPALPIAPRLIRYDTELQGDGEIVLLGNSVTLTPGTITVEVEPGELVVHTIDDRSSQDLIDGRLEGRIRRVFRNS